MSSPVSYHLYIHQLASSFWRTVGIVYRDSKTTKLSSHFPTSPFANKQNKKIPSKPTAHIHQTQSNKRATYTQTWSVLPFLETCTQTEETHSALKRSIILLSTASSLRASAGFRGPCLPCFLLSRSLCMSLYLYRRGEGSVPFPVSAAGWRMNAKHTIWGIIPPPTSS